MANAYPNISKKKSSITIKLNSAKECRRIDKIDFNLDVDSNTQNLIGIEIINLAEKIESKELSLENFEGLVDNIKWRISYDPKYDVAYIGFQEGYVASAEVRQETGTVLLDRHQNIIGFTIPRSP